ncbi:MAG: hypothetical protein EB119_07355 [Synechococcaceae bacterium WBB_34_004]|nr:hypothetical protein [Synechococcaceae bacterium WBB_34_004]
MAVSPLLAVLRPKCITQAEQQVAAVAAALGPTYWCQLQGPLAPLPFCIAAGGIAPKDLASWFAAGVQAVALGSSLFDSSNCLRPGHIDSLAPFAIIKPNRN